MLYNMFEVPMMNMAQAYAFPRLRKLPESLPRDGAISIELEEGVPVFRASTAVQSRIFALLEKKSASKLTESEGEELDQYEVIDDYLSHLNRIVRNILQSDGTSPQHT